MSTLTLKDAYERGYEEGLRSAENDALVAISTIVAAAGGQVRVSERFLVEDFCLTRSDDPATGDIVWRVGPKR